MDDGSAGKALERIEAALARIEGAAGRKDSEIGALQGRHDNLKATVAQSLARLDKLIGDRRA